MRFIAFFAALLAFGSIALYHPTTQANPYSVPELSQIKTGLDSVDISPHPILFLATVTLVLLLFSLLHHISLADEPMKLSEVFGFSASGLSPPLFS